jgi:hypothetical protein
VADKSKVYVINPVENFLQKGGVAKRGIERMEYSPQSEGPQTPRERRSRWLARRVASEPVDEKGSPVPSFLAYLAGPYAVLATSRGRESLLWVSLSILSCTIAAVVVALAGKIFAEPHADVTWYLAWLGATLVAVLFGFAAWARGVLLIGRHKGWLVRKLPGWLRQPAAALLLGLAVPGYGLFAIGHSRRAGCALLAAGATVVAALLLWQAPPLWRLSQATGVLAGRGDTLERLFLACGAVAALGALAWVVQALDGARLAGERGESPLSPRREWASVALIMAIMAMLASFRPARVAETVDRFAISLRDDGLRIVPLYASYLEMRLDPSMPGYAVQAIELNEELGRSGEALAMKRDLADRWRPYGRMLRLEAASASVETPGYGPEKP